MEKATLVRGARGGVAGPSRAGHKHRHAAARASKLVGAVAQSDERWDRQSLLRRQLRVAVAEQQFSHAAELRDRLAAVRSELPPQQQFLAAKLQLLDFGSPAEQLAALHAIGEVAIGMEILGELAEFLRNPRLDSAAASALSAIWHRHPQRNPAVEDLMVDCCRLLAAPHAAGLGTGQHNLRLAEQMCDQIIQLDPTFAEAWNKRGTCRFLLGRWREAIHDCEITLGLNSYHYGAMAGQGLCHMRLRETPQAIECMERALALYPGLVNVQHNLRALRKIQDGGMASA